MLLESIIPQLPVGPIETTVFVIGFLGTIFLIYSQFIEALNRRDLVRMVGAFSLFVYSIYIGNIIFSIASFGVFVAATVEFIEIYLGFHRSKETKVQEYKEVYKKFKNKNE